jgi:predicted nucleic acid-binding protein
MVLVDTTVWIDFFADRNAPQVAMLQDLIEKSAYFS